MRITTTVLVSLLALTPMLSAMALDRPSREVQIDAKIAPVNHVYSGQQDFLNSLLGDAIKKQKTPAMNRCQEKAAKMVLGEESMQVVSEAYFSDNPQPTEANRTPMPISQFVPWVVRSAIQESIQEKVRAEKSCHDNTALETEAVLTDPKNPHHERWMLLIPSLVPFALQEHQHGEDVAWHPPGTVDTPTETFTQPHEVGRNLVEDHQIHGNNNVSTAQPQENNMAHTANRTAQPSHMAQPTESQTANVPQEPTEKTGGLRGAQDHQIHSDAAKPENEQIASTSPSGKAMPQSAESTMTGCDTTMTAYKANLHAVMDHGWKPAKPPHKGVWEAKLSYNVLQDGRISEVRVTQSSGYPPLDQSAVNRIYSMQGQLSPMPTCFQESNLVIDHIFRVIYR